jgi:hypothetical protein
LPRKRTSEPSKEGARPKSLKITIPFIFDAIYASLPERANKVAPKEVKELKKSMDLVLRQMEAIAQKLKEPEER